MEDKIISILEKLTSVVQFLRCDTGRKYGLAPLQTRIMLSLGKQDTYYFSITRISEELELSKPTVSDAIKTLESKGLIFRRVVLSDKRRSRIMLTGQGERVVEKLRSWSDGVKDQLHQFPHSLRANGLFFLMELVSSLKESGVINVARMCNSCCNFIKNLHPGAERPHFCQLLDKEVRNSELKIGCGSYREMAGA